jgi:hypothetical protein
MVDDDLFAAFSEPGDSKQDDDPFASLDSTQEDDPFGSLGFDEEEDELFAPLPPEEPPAVSEEPDWATVAAEEPPPVTDERPEWLRELGGFEEEEERTPAPAPTQVRASRSRGGLMSGLVGSGPKGMALGMTAQQRMILSIFLFLDIAVLACLILIAIGAVNISLP